MQKRSIAYNRLIPQCGPSQAQKKFHLALEATDFGRIRRRPARVVALTVFREAFLLASTPKEFRKKSQG
jgi:hypothetical protein